MNQKLQTSILNIDECYFIGHFRLIESKDDRVYGFTLEVRDLTGHALCEVLPCMEHLNIILQIVKVTKFSVIKIIYAGKISVFIEVEKFEVMSYLWPRFKQNDNYSYVFGIAKTLITKNNENCLILSCKNRKYRIFFRNKFLYLFRLIRIQDFLIFKYLSIKNDEAASFSFSLNHNTIVRRCSLVKELKQYELCKSIFAVVQYYIAPLNLIILQSGLKVFINPIQIHFNIQSLREGTKIYIHNFQKQNFLNDLFLTYSPKSSIKLISFSDVKECKLTNLCIIFNLFKIFGMNYWCRSLLTVYRTLNIFYDNNSSYKETYIFYKNYVEPQNKKLNIISVPDLNLYNKNIFECKSNGRGLIWESGMEFGKKFPLIFSRFFSVKRTRSYSFSQINSYEITGNPYVIGYVFFDKYNCSFILTNGKTISIKLLITNSNKFFKLYNCMRTTSPIIVKEYIIYFDLCSSNNDGNILDFQMHIISFECPWYVESDHISEGQRFFVCDKSLIHKNNKFSKYYFTLKINLVVFKQGYFMKGQEFLFEIYGQNIFLYYIMKIGNFYQIPVMNSNSIYDYLQNKLIVNIKEINKLIECENKFSSLSENMSLTTESRDSVRGILVGCLYEEGVPSVLDSNLNKIILTVKDIDNFDFVSIFIKSQDFYILPKFYTNYMICEFLNLKRQISKTRSVYYITTSYSLIQISEISPFKICRKFINHNGASSLELNAEKYFRNKSFIVDVKIMDLRSTIIKLVDYENKNLFGEDDYKYTFSKIRLRMSFIVIDKYSNIAMLKFEEVILDINESITLNTIGVCAKTLQEIRIDLHRLKKIISISLPKSDYLENKYLEYPNDKTLNRKLIKNIRLGEDIFTVCICSNFSPKNYSFPIYQTLHIQKLV